MWLISNKQNICQVGCIRNNFIGYSLFSDKKTSSILNEISWFYQGHFIPRSDVHFKANHKNCENILPELHKQHGDYFIRITKGNFLLLQLEKERFKIYSDRFGIIKFFYWINSKEFIFSDNLKAITQNIHTIPSPKNMAIYALTYHFIGGKTIFENIHYNKPAEVVEFKGGKLHFSRYWDAGDLLKLEKRNVNIKEMTETIIGAVEQDISAVPQRKISLSLTGGADTRNLLSVFLKLGIKPHLYTYGNSLSADCVKAKAIAENLGLIHDVHNIQMNAILFADYARKVIHLGQSLASIHRAHRLLAIEHERAFAEVMFLGTLGGEFIKGVSEDDYIVPAIIYENWHRKALTPELIFDYCRRKALNTNAVDLAAINRFLNDQPFFIGDAVTRKLYALSHLTASLHDAQDVNLYKSIMDEVYTPFLDIDYLETVFSSRFTFDQKEKHKNPILKRIDNPVYASRFLKQVYPPLLQFEYSGNHKPSDVLINKYYAALAKYIRTKQRLAYPPNFPLLTWMEQFVNENLPKCYDFIILRNTFNIGALTQALKIEKHLAKESYWLKYTNPIMMMFLIEEYA